MHVDCDVELAPDAGPPTIATADDGGRDRKRRQASSSPRVTSPPAVDRGKSKHGPAPRAAQLLQAQNVNFVLMVS
jgi:hypothetical protein